MAKKVSYLCPKHDGREQGEQESLPWYILSNSSINIKHFSSCVKDDKITNHSAFYKLLTSNRRKRMNTTVAGGLQRVCFKICKSISPRSFFDGGTYRGYIIQGIHL